MSQKNSEKPYGAPEHDRADEILRQMPSVFSPPSLDKEEAYIERMIRRDREIERFTND